MRTFILIGKSRKTGKDELILGREAKGSEHIAAYKKLAVNKASDEYESVSLIESAPFKRPLKFITSAQAEEISKAEKEAKAAALTKAEKEAAAESKKSAAKKKAAKTETKTEGDTSPEAESK